MGRRIHVIKGALFSLAFFLTAGEGRILFAQTPAAAARTYPAQGIILEIKADTSQVVIRHEAIANYMDAMAMPFHMKSSAEVSGLQRGDKVTFQLHVTDNESWVDRILQKLEPFPWTKIKLRSLP